PIEVDPTAAVLRGRPVDMLKGWADGRRVRQVDAVRVRGLPAVEQHTRDAFLGRLRSEFGDTPLTQPRGVLQLEGPAADLSDVPADRVSEPHPTIGPKPGLGLVKDSERDPLPLPRPSRRSYRFKPPGPTDQIDPGTAEVDTPLSAHLRPVIEHVEQPNQNVVSLVLGNRRDLNPRVVVGATDRLPGLIPPGEHDRADQLRIPAVRALRGLTDTLRSPDRSPTHQPAAGHRVELIVGDQPVLL